MYIDAMVPYRHVLHCTEMYRVHTNMYFYLKVCTGMYLVHTIYHWYVLVHTKGPKYVPGTYFSRLVPVCTRMYTVRTGSHLEPCQNPISGHVYTISVYCDIVPDIGHDILRHDIGTYPILGDTISCHTRYQVCPNIGYVPISGPTSMIRIYRYRDHMSRYRVNNEPDIVLCRVPMSRSWIPISHTMSRVPAGPGPGAGFPRRRLLPLDRNRWGRLYQVQ